MVDNKFIVIVPVYNAAEYIEKCLDSILSQEYKNYRLVIIDDCSTDHTTEIINDCLGQSPLIKNSTMAFIINKVRLGSASGNIAKAISRFSYDPEDVIVTVDGDDLLANDSVLSYLDEVYQDPNIYMTYGQFLPLSKSYSKFCKPIPDTTTYRKSGQWYASHLRTFKNKLWKKIDDRDLRDEKGEYFKVAGDASWLYPLIEMCGSKHLKFIDEVLYLYNDLSPMNDMKANVREQLRIAAYIRSKPIYNKLDGGLS